MEIEQLQKSIDWLDVERRKDKNVLASLEERLKALEDNLPTVSKQVKSLESEISRLTAQLARFDHIDENLLQYRVETKSAIESLEKEVRRREEETEKVRRVELRAIDSNVEELRKEISQLPEIKRSVQARIDEEGRLNRSIDEVRQRIESLRRSEEEYTRTYRLLEDGRRQDAKRLSDLQGEVTAIRKHVDEQRGKMEVTANSLRKLETRLQEIVALEAERSEAQAKFLEKQALIQVERERTWKQWQARFEIIEDQTSEVEVSLQSLDATHREVKRSQQALDDLMAKVDRRINELSEIQRLSEERFRQEWVTFKADDQKRWTNYTLTQEEERGEIVRQYEKMSDRITHLEDTIQETQDLLHQVNEQTEKRLQGLLAVVHDWVTAYERSIGRLR